MPEYLAPGVFVEETSFRSKSIEGVSTSTTAFVGPTRRGPVNESPELLTGFADFERIYGGIDDLGPVATPKTNYLAHAVTAYFNEGGARLYVARAFPLSGTLAEPDPFSTTESARPGNPAKAFATVAIPPVTSGGSPTNVGHFQARFPGSAYNGKITVVQRAALSSAEAAKKAIDGSLFRVTVTTGTGSTATIVSTYYTKKGAVFTGPATTDAFPTADAAGTVINLLTLDVIAEDDRGEPLGTYEGLGYHPDHKLYIGWVLAIDQNRRADHLSTSFAFKPTSTATVFNLQKVFEPAASATSKTFTLAGGVEPTYVKGDYDAALALIEGIDDVSIVAAPGYSANDGTATVSLSLIAHAEKRRSYRIAVLDTPKSLLPTEARDVKAKIDSKYAALYYPWIVAPNPNFDPNNQNTDAEVVLPPSGFLCGIYARSDIERGVHKAPANEVVRSALRFERLVNTGEQEILNPAGVNCLRYFAGRGNRVWGARTTSSDPEWKYVNIRRYFNYLEHSIDKGTQWAVFEPNGERLWANIRDTVSGFLFNEWVNGALLGEKPEQAFFVKCDRSTMTQNDLDNGRLICLIGVAAIKPAEFVIFRIGQKTADARS